MCVVSDGVKLVEGETMHPRQTFVTVRELWISLRRFAGPPLAPSVRAEVFRGQQWFILSRVRRNRVFQGLFVFSHVVLEMF